MKTILAALVAFPMVSGVALAADKVALSDKQMDKVTAGFRFMEIDITNTSTTAVLVNFPGTSCAGCYLQVTSEWWGSPTNLQPMQVYSRFGPTVLTPAP